MMLARIIVVIAICAAFFNASVRAQPAADRPDYRIADRWEFRMTETPGGKVSPWARETIEIRIAKERFELRAFHSSGPPSDTVSVSELERFMPGR